MKDVSALDYYSFEGLADAYVDHVLYLCSSSSYDDGSGGVI